MEQKYSETDLWSTRLYTHTIDQSKVDVNIYTSKSHVVIWKVNRYPKGSVPTTNRYLCCRQLV